MKKLFLNLLFALPFAAFSQFTTTNPDTVCYHTAGSKYAVPSLGAGYTYTWTVASPGVIVSGQGTDSLKVDWSAANAGLINNAISVTATNSSGCTSQPVTVNVFILQIVPSIAVLGPFCASEPCVPLIGTPPAGVWTGTGVVNGQFCPNVANIGPNNITYTVTQSNCILSTSSTINVNSTPILLPISHN
jgi:hypothetical protein